MEPLERSVPPQSEGAVAQAEQHEHNGTTKKDKEQTSRSPSSRDTDSRKQSHRLGIGSQSRSHRSPSRSQDNDTKRRKHRRRSSHSSKSRSTSSSRSRSPSRDCRRRRKRSSSRSSSRRRYPDEQRSDDGYDYHDRRIHRHRPRNGGGGGDRHPRRRHNNNNNRRRTPSPSHHRITSRERDIANLDRESRTVFASNLNLRADERDLFAFFSTAGPLVDIKIIKDRYSSKSKGIAYIEFDNRDSVAAALALTGQPINGQPVMVKASEAEKNVAWKVAEEQKRAARAMGLQGPGAVAAMHAAQAAQSALGAMGVTIVSPPPAAAGGGFIMNGGTTAATNNTNTITTTTTTSSSSNARLTVSNLHPSITETDIKPIFEPFGPINHVSMQINTTNNTNTNTAGCATVEYTNEDDAIRAAESLQGLDIAGHKISITMTLPATSTDPYTNTYAHVDADTTTITIPPAVVDLPEKLEGDATDGGGMKLTAQTRAALMTRLAVGAGLKVPTPTIPGPSTLGGGGGGNTVPVSTTTSSIIIPESLALEQGVLGPASPIPTQCLLLKNMFDPGEETEEGWSEDIAEDVRGECAKYGEVVFLHVDTESRGLVYLKFGTVQAAAEAQKAMHGRWFGARLLAADYQFTQIFNNHFGLN